MSKLWVESLPVISGMPRKCSMLPCTAT